MSAGYRGEGTKQVEIFKLVLIGCKWFNSSGSKYSTLHSKQSKAAFILEVYIDGTTNT